MSSQPLILHRTTEVFSPGSTRKKISSESPRKAKSNEKLNSLALGVSMIANIVISAIKLLATIVSGSLAVTATLVDSVLDVVSQFILYYTDSASRKGESALFPAGRTRLAPLGIFICAVIMGMASIEVIHESVIKLISAELLPELVMNSVVLWAMALSFLGKFFLYIYCNRVYRITNNDTVKAVALDHLNDILSVGSATGAALISFYYDSFGWVDPVSAIAISLYIMREWWETAEEQADMLVGKAASDVFLTEVRRVGDTHHPEMRVDIIRAYHFGPKYLVELEVVLPPTMTLQLTHDIGMELQHKIEAFEEVERAFVHIDYIERDYDEHNEKSWPSHYAEKVKSNCQIP